MFTLSGKTVKNKMWIKFTGYLSVILLMIEVKNTPELMANLYSCGVEVNFEE